MFEPFVLSESKHISLSTGSRRTEIKTSQGRINNPEERLNADLKQAIGKKVPVRTKAKLRDAAKQHMDILESNPERVLSFFQDKMVKYAA
jgi:hypothetical protein